MTLLARGDLSQIEARMTAWLAGATAKLDGFRKADRKEGPGLYELGAAGIYGVRPEEIGEEDPRRQVGKVSELALGFQGGVGALQTMARAYGLKIPKAPHDERGELIRDRERPPPDGTDLWIVNRWRAANPECSDKETGLWARLERAALGCVQSKPGEVFEAVSGKLSFKRNGSAMVMRLPSGRALWYWSPRLRVRRTPWGEDKLVVTYCAEDAQTHQWTEFAAYGGLWTENAVQAAARDIMRDGLVRCEKRGLRPVLTVHDEVVCEVAGDDRARALASVREAMVTPPAWAPDLPLAAACSAAPRYLK